MGYGVAKVHMDGWIFHIRLMSMSCEVWRRQNSDIPKQMQCQRTTGSARIQCGWFAWAPVLALQHGQPLRKAGRVTWKGDMCLAHHFSAPGLCHVVRGDQSLTCTVHLTLLHWTAAPWPSLCVLCSCALALPHARISSFL